MQEVATHLPMAYLNNIIVLGGSFFIFSRYPPSDGLPEQLDEPNPTTVDLVVATHLPMAYLNNSMSEDAKWVVVEVSLPTFRWPT